VRNETPYILHIIECVDRIGEYLAGGWETYAASSLIEDAVLRRLQVLGESTQKLSQGTKDVYPEIPWAQIVGMGNVLTHGYFSIDPELVRHTVENDLPTSGESSRQFSHHAKVSAPRRGSGDRRETATPSACPPRTSLTDRDR